MGGESSGDTLALIFIIISCVGGLIAILSFIFALRGNGSRLKGFALFLASFAFGLFISSLVTGIIGYAKYDPFYKGHYPCTWESLGLGSGSVIFSLASLGFALKVFTKRASSPKVKKEPRQVQQTYQSQPTYKKSQSNSKKGYWN